VIRFATSRPAVVWALCVALLLAGGLAFTRLPLATRTTVELPRLSVGAFWAGASPEVMETFLTSPIEAAVQSVRGVKSVSSTSSDGSAMLTVELEPRADVQMVRLGILERLELLRRELPPGAFMPTVSNYVPEGLQEPPLLSLTIFGPYTPGTLQRILDRDVGPRLSSVPGVSGVQVRGGTSLGVSVSYDPTRLRQLGLTPQLLSDALSNARLVQALGTLESRDPNGRRRFARTVVLRDQPGSLEELGALPVRAPGGRVFRLDELATIRAEEDARGRFFRIDGEPAVAIDISRHAGADAIETAAAVRRAIDDLRTRLPLGVRLKVTSDQSEDLARDLGDLAKRGSIAFVSVLLVLLLLMRRWRAVAVVMGTTAVAIAATALSLYVFRIPANLLTLAGLSMGVGILVQNAIVVVERLQRVPDSANARAATTQRMAPAVLGSTLTTAVVLFPFLYLQGNTRAAFMPFALAFLLALGWSVFAALCIVPAIGRVSSTHSITLRRAQQSWRRPWHRLRRGFARVSYFLLRWRWATLLVTTGALGVLSYGFVVKVPRSSFNFWGDRRTTLSVYINFPRGSDPVTLDAAMAEFEALVVGRPEVEQVRATSSGGTGAQMTVVFTREGGFSATPLEMQELLTQRAVLVGGANISVVGEGPAFSSGGGGGSFASFRIQLRGFNYAGLQQIGEDLASRLATNVRVRDIRITSGGWFSSERGSQVSIEPDRRALTRYGLNALQFMQAVSREVRGPVGRQPVDIDGEELPVTVKAIGASARSLDELQDALIPTTGGAPVRIRDVAVVAEREALGSVVREDQQYVRQLVYDFRGPARLARRTHEAFMKSVSAPAGYEIRDLSSGFGFEQEDSARGLWLVFGIGVTLVLLAVALVFDSVWAAAMVFVSLPLALAGVAAAFWLAKAPFTREAAVGVILVVGLAVNQTILLVDAVLPLRRKYGRLTRGVLLRALLDRVGMIVIVTAAALASLIPLSVGTGTDTLFGAIALATAGGTVAGTLGVLFVLPSVLGGARRSPAEQKV
jgi:hydrophobic/amphiphilic exporter-1 (mainly G- bacteria), HAE1 family